MRPSEKLLKLSVNEIDLSVRAANCLNNANITTVGQLRKYGRKNLLKLRNCGRRTVDEIENALSMLGLKMAVISAKDQTILDLEKELKKSTSKFNELYSLCESWRIAYADERQSRKQKEQDTAEEIARLKRLLCRAVVIAEAFHSSGGDWKLMSALRHELDNIRWD